MNHDELEGKLDRAKGELKQAAGHATNDQDLHDRGVADEASGKVQEGFGKAKRKVGEAVEDIGDSIKR
ncbi:MAG: CsbD family protein [Acidobacteriota bacterium]|nr:CsbD family protein [Acidobacteriota bacterium]